MISQNPKKRPTCDLLLSKSDEWCINYDDLKNDYEFNKLKHRIITITKIEDGFNLYFLNKKLTQYFDDIEDSSYNYYNKFDNQLYCKKNNESLNNSSEIKSIPQFHHLSNEELKQLLNDVNNQRLDEMIKDFQQVCLKFINFYDFLVTEYYRGIGVFQLR